MIEGGGGYLKNMAAISGGLEKNWNKKQFLLHTPPPPHPSNLNYDWSLTWRSLQCVSCMSVKKKSATKNNIIEQQPRCYLSHI